MVSWVVSRIPFSEARNSLSSQTLHAAHARGCRSKDGNEEELRRSSRRRPEWWISCGDLSRKISPTRSRGRQLLWCRPRWWIVSRHGAIHHLYHLPFHLALESEHSKAIYSLRIVINVDRSAPCYLTSPLLRPAHLPLFLSHGRWLLSVDLRDVLRLTLKVIYP